MEKTPENSFVCEECLEHQLDGNMSVLSCTKWYEGLICIECSYEYPKELEKAIAARDKEDGRP